MDVKVCIFVLLLAGVSATCRFPGAPAHSRVTFTNNSLSEGTVALYNCERGFERLGPSRRVCGPSGRWTPDGIPFCVVNVAAGKAPMQVSTEDGGVPQRALDGRSAPGFNAETCSLTRLEPVPWWYVNLLEPYMVQLVRLDFGKPCCGMHNPAVIVVRVGNNRPDLSTNPICNRYTGFIEEGQPLYLPCSPPMPGAFVSVHLETTSPSQLSICEAFVYTDQALPVERCPRFRDQPPGSMATYNGKCYLFYERQQSSFKDALGLCRASGGTLVDEGNSALQGFISWELWRRHRSDSGIQYWMGAVRDPQDENNWKWVTGRDVTVSFWNGPGGHENCAQFDGSKGWLWTTTDCRSKKNYICQHHPKSCGRPEQPPNSTMVADGFTVGSSVQYACDDGYLLVGPTVRTCLDSGFYDEFPPLCKRIECGFPAQIAHGRYRLLNDSVAHLAHVQYSCEPGYEMQGRARLVCDIDERWNGPPPRCEEVHCGDPPGIANGRVKLLKANATLGARAHYSCVRGFVLFGSDTAECLATGLWSPPMAECLPEEPPLTSTTTTTNPSTTTTRPPPRTTKPPPPPATEPTTPRLYLTPRTTARPSPAPFSTEPSPRQPHPKTERPPTRTSDSQGSATTHVASPPSERQVIVSGDNIRTEHTPRTNFPTAPDAGQAAAAPVSGQLNMGTVVSLAVFGALMFLIALITTLIILLKSRRESGSPYTLRHLPRIRIPHSNPPSGSGSGESSLSESRSGLTRSYRQAWDQLHEASAAAHELPTQHPPSDNHPANRPREQLLGLPPDRDVLNRTFMKRHHHHHHRSTAVSPQTSASWRRPQFASQRQC